ncbi:tripartite tricarboxylate transporter substrate-binding protein [Methylocella sp. CPCC 101449]|uniref:Bug family tripartite tricarboxylate transporter substrate binding protein n=1 Tax=Methylocella sp. CPCC 101449 TaxID=2987531 RepID=UPI002890495C|nr:tripartite tricarboxylate transporter substrate-binding protein [Methylocella sp. CPCC 101449]MDT2023310.1 tripartite tricarboxylate transporter substrate-binding protein [Methylocella sp. CPCC 101449]
MTMQRTMRTALCGGFILGVLGTVAQAQTTYPDRPVRFVVSFAPGGPADVGARIIGQALQDHWGKAVVIENRGGAGGNIATVAVARGEADGYTVLASTSSFSVNLSYYPNPGYSASDFKVAALVATTPNIVVGAPDLPAANLADVLKLAKTQPLAYAGPGAGTTPHLSAERIFRLIGKVDIRHVPFTGAGPAMNAVTAGHVQLGVVAMTPAIELVKAGKLKGYAITATKRTPELPDVPTMAETGIGQVDDATWIALFVPAKTPDAIVAKINADANAALKNSATVQLINRAGMSPLGGSLEEINAYVSSETKKWEEVVRAVGLKAEESK